MRGLRQTPVHLELFGDGSEMFGEIGEVFISEIDVEIFGIELDAHQEEAGFFIGVFVGVEDVAAAAVDEVGDGGDFAFLVGAGDEEDGGVLHFVAPPSRRPVCRRDAGATFSGTSISPSRHSLPSLPSTPPPDASRFRKDINSESECGSAPNPAMDA